MITVEDVLKLVEKELAQLDHSIIDELRQVSSLPVLLRKLVAVLKNLLIENKKLKETLETCKSGENNTKQKR